jgi:hypothetical protein
MVPQDVVCKLHAGVPATHRCACCNGYMCATCDFNLGGGLHVCPTCAMASAVQGLGPRRKRTVIWGYALASIGTITLVLLMVGAFAPMLQGPGGASAAGIIISIFTFVPAAAGFGAASSACEARLPNTFSIWGAIIWNALLILAFMALTVVGLFS